MAGLRLLIAALVIAGLVQAVLAQVESDEPLWSYEIDNDVKDVSVSSDGSYIAAGSGYPNNSVYFFNREGKLLWSYKAGSYHVSGVSVSFDGSYIAAGSSDIYFFSREGKLLWSYEIDGVVYGVSVSSDGSYITAASGNYVYFFNREGKLLWSYNTTVGSVSEVSVSSDGSYIAAGSDKVNLFSKEGKLLWSYNNTIRTRGVSWVVVSVSSDGSYIVAGSGNYVYFGNIHKRISSAVISDARQVISFEKNKGFNLVEAENMLFQAEQKVEAGDYKKARELAEQAKAFALDIDSDGVPNNSDFAPLINNYYSSLKEDKK